MAKQPSRRLKILRIIPALLMEIFQTGNKKHFEIIQGVPKDARVVDIQTEWNTRIDLLIESKEFDEVPEGADIPESEAIIIKRLE